jgi:hypothetical protein
MKNTARRRNSFHSAPAGARRQTSVLVIDLTSQARPGSCMILTDREIRASLANGLIIIEPLPADEAYDSTTVDLTLDPTVRLFKAMAPGLSVSVDPRMRGYKAAELIKNVTEPFTLPDNGWDLEPKKLVLDGRENVLSYLYMDVSRHASRGKVV